jgi:integrase
VTGALPLEPGRRFLSRSNTHSNTLSIRGADVAADRPRTRGRRSTARAAPIFRRAAFDRRAEAIGIPGLHPHELHHTAGSLAIAAGADVKVAQKMLGHKSATTTLDQYGHLFEDRLDDVADRLGAAADAYVISNSQMCVTTSDRCKPDIQEPSLGAAGRP